MKIYQGEFSWKRVSYARKEHFPFHIYKVSSCNHGEYFGLGPENVKLGAFSICRTAPERQVTSQTEWCISLKNCFGMSLEFPQNYSYQFQNMPFWWIWRTNLLKYRIPFTNWRVRPVGQTIGKRPTPRPTCDYKRLILRVVCSVMHNLNDIFKREY